MDELREKTERAIRELKESGRTAEAEHLENALTSNVGDAFLLILRDACQTVLTAIEAIGPNTEMLLEQVRMKIDTVLLPDREQPKPE